MREGWEGRLSAGATFCERRNHEQNRYLKKEKIQIQTALRYQFSALDFWMLEWRFHLRGKKKCCSVYFTYNAYNYKHWSYSSIEPSSRPEISVFRAGTAVECSLIFWKALWRQFRCRYIPVGEALKASQNNDWIWVYTHNSHTRTYVLVNRIWSIGMLTWLGRKFTGIGILRLSYHPI